MATIVGAPDDNVKSLMETLQAQQDLLQQLYTELDVEREASATATDESLSMILRLQGEKSAVEMEASQYKRIAEQKMFYAQETLETFRDLIYQKEMQIASLEFQVQSFKFKLISLGCKDVGDIETTYPPNMLSRGNSLPKGQGLASKAVRRGCSLPPHFLEDGGEPPVVDRKASGIVEITSDLGKSKSGDFSSYWQRIKRLDERVKELSISKDVFDGGNKSASSVSDPLRVGRADEVDAVDVREPLLGMEPCGDSSAPSKVHDIFEVPQDGAMLKTVISGVMDKSNCNQRPALTSDIDSVFPKPREGMAVEQLYYKRPDVTDFELQQMNRRLKRLEDERIMVTPRQDNTFEEDDYKLMLLKDIKDQLNSIEDEIMGWKPKKRPPKKEADITCLKEAMLHFWS